MTAEGPRAKRARVFEFSRIRNIGVVIKCRGALYVCRTFAVRWPRRLVCCRRISASRTACRCRCSQDGLFVRARNTSFFWYFWRLESCASARSSFCPIFVRVVPPWTVSTACTSTCRRPDQTCCYRCHRAPPARSRARARLRVDIRTRCRRATRAAIIRMCTWSRTSRSYRCKMRARAALIRPILSNASPETRRFVYLGIVLFHAILLNLLRANGVFFRDGFDFNFSLDGVMLRLFTYGHCDVHGWRTCADSARCHFVHDSFSMNDYDHLLFHRVKAC